jgi:hypothetical protein
MFPPTLQVVGLPESGFVGFERFPVSGAAKTGEACRTAVGARLNSLDDLDRLILQNL